MATRLGLAATVLPGQVFNIATQREMSARAGRAGVTGLCDSVRVPSVVEAAAAAPWTPTRCSTA